MVFISKVVINNGLRRYWCAKCEGPADWPGLFVFYCFNYMPWSVTTMPSILLGEVVDMVFVMGILTE